MAADGVRTTEPSDRLTRLCGVMTDALDANPERGTEKAIIFLQDGERGGLQLHGYDSDIDALADLFIHMRAMFRANGKELGFFPFPKGEG